MSFVDSTHFDEDEIICVKCDFSGFLSGACVMTPHKTIINALNEPINRKENKQVMFSSLRCLLQYKKPEFDIIYGEKGSKWDDWCNDLIIYQVARFKHFGTNIVICNNPLVKNQYSM
jgi:hypothetical protein